MPEYCRSPEPFVIVCSRVFITSSGVTRKEAVAPLITPDISAHLCMIVYVSNVCLDLDYELYTTTSHVDILVSN